MVLTPNFFSFAYLMATLFFIYGLKGLSSPRTALRGNLSAMIGMGLAIGVTLFYPQVKHYFWIFLGLFLGALIGTGIALKMSMTAMPQLVAILHSFVGLSAVLVAIGTFLSQKDTGLSYLEMIELVMGSFIGAITFTGSLIAFGKLQEILTSNPLKFKGQNYLNLALGFFLFIFGIRFLIIGDLFSFLIIIGISFVLGAFLVLPIGGADMPVVVSILNSYSGWAAAATGFIMYNPLLITTGALVGSSGAILSYIMCKAMNRSILNVIFGGIGQEQVSVFLETPQKVAKHAAIEDVSFMLENASKVIIIPGYGLAVAHAQHAVKDVYSILLQKGVEVKFAIHPVAGRMPGHMNVLLAESDIPYDHVFEMDEVNSEFALADVALVIGANDVVNPAAQNNPASPLYGMPILEAYKAKQIFVCKRSMSVGYAGVDNDLFYLNHCSLVFGDAKKTCESLALSMCS